MTVLVVSVCIKAIAAKLFIYLLNSLSSVYNLHSIL